MNVISRTRPATPFHLATLCNDGHITCKFWTFIAGERVIYDFKRADMTIAQFCKKANGKTLRKTRSAYNCGKDAYDVIDSNC